MFLMLVTPCSCVLSYLHISEERGASYTSTVKMNTAGQSETYQIVTSHMIPNTEEYNLKINLTCAVTASSTRTGKCLYICSVCEYVGQRERGGERLTLGPLIDRCSTRPESQGAGRVAPRSHLRCLRALVRHVTSWRRATESNDGVCSLSLSLSLHSPEA